MKVVVVSISIFVGLFSAFSLIFYFGDWSRLIIVSLMGFFVGLVAAPELEPKLFKFPLLFQVISGSLFGVLLGTMFSDNIQVISASTIICGFIGSTASIWLKHFPIP